MKSNVNQVNVLSDNALYHAEVTFDANVRRQFNTEFELN